MTPIALALLTAFLFGAVFVMARSALATAPSAEAGAIVINGTAFAVTLLAMLVANTSIRSISLRAEWPFVIAGVLAPGLSQLFFLKAIGAAGASRPAIVIGATPVLSAGAAIIFLAEPFSAGFALGTGAIACGAALLAGEKTGTATARSAGLVFALVSAAMFAARDNLVRFGIGRSAEEAPPLLGASTLLMAATVTTLVYGVAVHRSALAGQLRSATVPYLPSGLAVGLAYVCLAESLARARVTVVAPLTATQTLWATLLAAMFLGHQEAIGRRIALTSLLILGGAAVVGMTR